MEKKKLVEEVSRFPQREHLDDVSYCVQATRDFTAWKDAEKAKRRAELKDRRAERLNS